MGRPAAAQEKLLTDWGTFVFERDLGSTSGIVAGPADSVYRILRASLADVKLEMKEDDPISRQLGVRRLRVSRRIGRKPVSAFLSCGEGITGANVDLWHVCLNLGARVSPAPKGARLQLILSADAVDVPGGRSERVPCATTGRLELDILTHLRQVFPGT
jgi:hypothetical protein